MQAWDHVVIDDHKCQAGRDGWSRVARGGRRRLPFPLLTGSCAGSSPGGRLHFNAAGELEANTVWHRAQLCSVAGGVSCDAASCMSPNPR